jgi:restriction system protein
MARGGVLTGLVRAARAIDRESQRQSRAAARDYKAALRQAEAAWKEAERAQIQTERADAADNKKFRKEAKAREVSAREAVVNVRNSELALIYDDLDGLLAATLGVDDYVDLEALRSVPKRPPFDRSDLSFLGRC